MNKDDQEAKDSYKGLITRATTRNIKDYDDILAIRIVAFFEEAMKNGQKSKNEVFVDGDKPSKLFKIHAIGKDQSM